MEPHAPPLLDIWVDSRVVHVGFPRDLTGARHSLAKFPTLKEARAAQLAMLAASATLIMERT